MQADSRVTSAHVAGCGRHALDVVEGEERSAAASRGHCCARKYKGERRFSEERPKRRTSEDSTDLDIVFPVVRSQPVSLLTREAPLHSPVPARMAHVVTSSDEPRAAMGGGGDGDGDDPSPLHLKNLSLNSFPSDSPPPPRPPLVALLEDMPDFVATEIIARLDPSDFAVLAQVASHTPVLTTPSTHRAIVPMLASSSTT